MELTFRKAYSESSELTILYEHKVRSERKTLRQSTYVDNAKLASACARSGESARSWHAWELRSTPRRMGASVVQAAKLSHVFNLI